MINLNRRHLSWKLATTSFFIMACQIFFAFSLLTSKFFSAEFWMYCGFLILFSIAFIEQKKLLQSFSDYIHDESEQKNVDLLVIAGLVCFALALWLS